jgi:hypothetical protein
MVPRSFLGNRRSHLLSKEQVIIMAKMPGNSTQDALDFYAENLTYIHLINIASIRALALLEGANVAIRAIPPFPPSHELHERIRAEVAAVAREELEKLCRGDQSEDLKVPEKEVEGSNVIRTLRDPPKQPSEAASESPSFKVGDRVRVTATLPGTPESWLDSRVFCTGVVQSVLSGYCMIRMDADFEEVAISTNRLELAQTDFKVGERVECLDGPLKGEEGFITITGSGLIGVIFDRHGGERYFPRKDLKHCEIQKLCVGDRVAVLQNGLHEGAVTTVLSDGTVTVDTKYAEFAGISPKEVRLIKPSRLRPSKRATPKKR